MSKTLKGNLIKLGLLVPLAVAASIGVAVADPQKPIEVKSDDAKFTDQLKDASTIETAIDNLTLAIEGRAAVAASDDGTPEVTEVTADPWLGEYVRTQKDLSAGLLNFNPAQLSSGGFAVQLNSNSKTITKKSSDGSKNERATTADATGILAGVSSVSSLNGSDKLVYGAFGGIGTVKFGREVKPAKLHDTDTPTDPTSQDFGAVSEGFGGGFFATYQLDGDAATGLSVSALVRADQFDHLLTNGKAGSNLKNYAARVVSLHGKANVAYSLVLTEVAGYPIVAKSFIEGNVDHSLKVGDKEGGHRKDFTDFSLSGGAALSTVLLDGTLKPSLSLGVVKPFESKDKFLGLADTSADIQHKATAALDYKLGESLAIGASTSFGVNYKDLKLEDAPGITLGVSYLF